MKNEKQVQKKKNPEGQPKAALKLVNRKEAKSKKAGLAEFHASGRLVWAWNQY